ncbi:uncharacterized protein DNG_02076 [Cephalotrichum gorgonifer]|uniref:F-box domain-containing protein n=1 Tax=Cephalotrichum gorgonifer TaxID=2041049 RepID=A0AAE8MSZ6_9PEZI|nr:uncharacterized protein DNG_02076 [Cephalotrichum gorgonifer]
MDVISVTLADRYPEIFHLVCDNLGFVDLINLSMTCMNLFGLVDAREIMDKRGCLKEAMREIDRQEHPDNKLACYTCTRMLPKSSFSYGQCRDKFASRKGRRQTDNMTRICVHCAIETKFYQHLEPVRFRGEQHFLCHECGFFERGLERCRKMFVPEGDSGRFEVEVTVCYDDLPDPCESLSPLEALPRMPIQNIVWYLDYKEGLNLSMVSKWMYHVVKPAEFVPIHERYLFTNKVFLNRDPAPWRPHVNYDFPSRRKLPCFVCFRVRDKKHFSRRQIIMAHNDMDGYWRMRCNSCLYKLYIERDAKLLTRYYMYQKCETCLCLKIKGKSCICCAEWIFTGMLDDPSKPGPRPWEDFHVGSYDPWRGKSFLTDANWPLK